MEISWNALKTDFKGETCFTHARGVVLENGFGLFTAQPLRLSGCDVFYGMYISTTADGGETWSPLKQSKNLVRRDIGGGIQIAMCDATPTYHRATGKLLLLGHYAAYINDKLMPSPRPRHTVYSVYDAETGDFSPFKLLEMPTDAEETYFACGNGSGQSLELPNGELLIPVYYSSKQAARDPWHSCSSVSVLRCAFDGESLRLLEIGNRLTVSAPAGDIKTIEAATIMDDGAEKQLIVLIHPGIELATAKNITPVKLAKLVTNEIQQAVNLNGKGAKVKVNFSKKHPAGTYAIWNCVRYSNQQQWTRVNLTLPQGGTQEVFRHINSASEFLKSKFFGENGRGKFFWTYPNTSYTDCIYHKLGKPFDSLNYNVVISGEKYVELAGTIILPDPSTEYFDEMVKTLSGINHNKWYVDEGNAKK